MPSFIDYIVRGERCTLYAVNVRRIAEIFGRNGGRVNVVERSVQRGFVGEAAHREERRQQQKTKKAAAAE